MGFVLNTKEAIKWIDYVYKLIQWMLILSLYKMCKNKIF